MTSRTTARIAGGAFLAYIAAGLTGMAFFTRATPGADVPARLDAAAVHVTELRLSLLLTLVSAFCALVLAATLYGLTRHADRELAVFGLVCRAGEGILGMYAFSTLGVLWLVTSPGALAPEVAAPTATVLLRAAQWKATTCALLFAAGSTAFCAAFLRGAIIPPALALLGVAASVLLVVALPLELAGWVGGTMAFLVMWMPMLVFELWLAGWLILRGPQTR